MIDKKMKILKYIYDFIVTDKFIIYELFKYKNVNTSKNILYKLEKENLVTGKNVFVNFNKIYTTTRKANKLLNHDTKAYKIINSFNVLHELFLSYIVIFFMKKYNFSYNDFIPNRIARTFWSEHIPDLLINKNNKIIYIEYERKEKNIERIENNVIKNNLSCDFQYWICETKYIYFNVSNTLKQYNLQGEVILKDDIINYLKGECKDENYKLYF